MPPSRQELIRSLREYLTNVGYPVSPAPKKRPSGKAHPTPTVKLAEPVPSCPLPQTVMPKSNVSPTPPSYPPPPTERPRPKLAPCPPSCPPPVVVTPIPMSTFPKHIMVRGPRLPMARPVGMHAQLVPKAPMPVGQIRDPICIAMCGRCNLGEFIRQSYMVAHLWQTRGIYKFAVDDPTRVNHCGSLIAQNDTVGISARSPRRVVEP
jgi:hypothetical protein